MYSYKGREDPMWVSPDELKEEEEVHCRISMSTGVDADAVFMEVKVEPFYHDAPMREVCFFFIALFWA